MTRYFILFSLWIVTWLTSGSVKADWHAPGLHTAKRSLNLEDTEYTYSIDSNYLERVELDQNLDLSKAKVIPNNTLYIFNEDTKKEYWYRFSVTNFNKETTDWFIASYFYTLDEIDVLIQDSEGKVEKQYFRDTMGIYSRNLEHKQPIFTLKLLPFETKTVYIRVKNESTYEYSFGIFSHFHFFSIYFRENLLTGLFYGLMLFVFVYSAINFIFFRDKVVLFYLLFILSQVIHMLFRDGNGLYILPAYPEYADLFKNLSRASQSVFICVYTLAFLKIKRTSQTFKIVMAFIIARIIFALIMLNSTSFITFHFEFSAIILCTFLAYKAYYSKVNDAKYIVVGFSALCFSYFIFYLSVVWFSEIGNIGFFIMYFGIAIEGIFTTLALIERFKNIKVDNFRKDQMYKELEKTVAERTELITIQNKILKEQSNELNLFLYSASHDLKGPLKSIEGLINLAEKDPQVDHKQIYDMIREKLINLESNISDLTSVTTIKNRNNKTEIVNFNKIHSDTLRRFQAEIKSTGVAVDFKLSITNPFIGDPFAIKTIYENIFENALKFRDVDKKPTVSVLVEQRENNLYMTFRDNGVGIDENRVQNVFNMFYRGNERAKNDTGLGLYIVRISVKKLNGDIKVESKLGEGAVFHIILPYPK